MGYRTQRRFKQEQRAFADWQCEQDRKLDQHFEAFEDVEDFEAGYSEWSEDRKAREVEMMRGW